MNLGNIKITIVGLGYVGLPLAVEFGKKYPTVGYDIDNSRIRELEGGIDRTRELDGEEISEAKFLSFTSKLKSERKGEFKSVYIITVPTPIDGFKRPDLTPLLSASHDVGEILLKGDYVIYESTVYPGCTEEDCVPVLEKESGLVFNKDFFCGYSPERINPGDKVNTLTKILKITSGSTEKAGDFVDSLYSSIISAGTFRAASLKVAEAAKLVENCQRDVNISFVNELALIFEKVGIDTSEVLEAAGTKWNFLKFKPGLVGGHCIGVDPYYMIHKAESLGYHPALIGAGRRINDNMGVFVANRVIKLMIQKGIPIKDSNALILGFTFKENCPDIRNTRVIDIYNELGAFGLNVDVYDPWSNKEEVKRSYNIDLLESIERKYDTIILAVGHSQFKSIQIEDLNRDPFVFYDIKGFMDKELVDSRL